MTQVAATAVIGDDVSLADDVVVEDFVRIGVDSGDAPVSIGPGSVIRAGAIIYSGVTAGARLQTGHHVVVRSGTTIGSDVTVGTHVVIDGQGSIGDGVSIQTGVYIPPRTFVGDLTFLGPWAVLTNDRAMGSFARGLMQQGAARLSGPPSSEQHGSGPTARCSQASRSVRRQSSAPVRS